MSYTAMLAATGAGPNTWAIVANSGALPAGLTLGADGRIAGTTSQPQVTSFAVRVTDAAGHTATRWLSLSIVVPSQPQTRFNTAGPGAMLVSYFNPAPTGDPVSLRGYGAEAT